MFRRVLAAGDGVPSIFPVLRRQIWSRQTSAPLQAAEPAHKRSGGRFVGRRGAGPLARRGLQGSPVTGETPATAIAGVACSAASRLVGLRRRGWWLALRTAELRKLL